MTNTLNTSQQSAIGLLLVTKAFERLAFYLVLSILVLYLTDSLQPGTNLTGYYYALFMGSIFITSLFSGLMGDIRNRKKVVITGFVLLTTMYLAASFLPGNRALMITVFVLMGAGIGLTTPNMVVLLGNIYNEKEVEIRGLSGFILYMLAANLGALFAPLLSIFLKEQWGYTAVFLLAAVCGLIALLFFFLFSQPYGRLDLVSEQKTYKPAVSVIKLNRFILYSMLIIAVLIGFSLQQRSSTLAVAISDLTGKGVEIASMLVPLEKYLLPVLLLLFAWWVSRIKTINWSKIFQLMLLGLAVAITGYLIIAGFASLKEVVQEKIILYPSYIFLLIAESLLSSTILYTVYRSSPIKYKGLFQGVYHVAIAVSSSLLFPGVLLYQKMGSIAIVLIVVLLLISAGILIWVRRSVAGKEEINQSAS